MDGKLIHIPTGRQMAVGEIVETDKGEKWEIRDWWTKPAPSSGRVLLRVAGGEWEHPYYPSVIECKIVGGKYG